MIQPNIFHYIHNPLISNSINYMPKPMKIQNRDEKKVDEALLSLKPKAKFLNWMHEQLKKALKFIKELDKNYKP